MNRVLLSNISDNLGIKSHRKSAAYPDHFIYRLFNWKGYKWGLHRVFRSQGFPTIQQQTKQSVCVCVYVRCMEAPSLKVLTKERRPVRVVTSPSVHQPTARTLQKQ